MRLLTRTFYAWRMKKFSVPLLCLLCVPVAVSAASRDDTIFDEDVENLRPYKETPGSEWREEDLVLPPYPHDDALIAVDVGHYDFPYRVYVDRTSLSVGEDRVVRYTVVLRSRTGVDNVSFEGIRCSGPQFKRYAYGVKGQFHPVPVNDWAYISRKRQNIYRRVLAEDYFCPLPSGDALAGIRARLKGGAGDLYNFQGDEE